MMQAALATDETLEGLALGLLGRYERDFGALAAPPVPVEQIVENVLDLGILWEPIYEGPDEHILAELLPESRTVVFNERRHLLIEQTPGLYNTILGHEAGHWEAHVHRETAEQVSIPGLEQSIGCVFRRTGTGSGRGRGAPVHGLPANAGGPTPGSGTQGRPLQVACPVSVARPVSGHHIRSQHSASAAGPPVRHGRRASVPVAPGVHGPVAFEHLGAAPLSSASTSVLPAVPPTHEAEAA